VHGAVRLAEEESVQGGRTARLGLFAQATRTRSFRGNVEQPILQLLARQVMARRVGRTAGWIEIGGIDFYGRGAPRRRGESFLSGRSDFLRRRQGLLSGRSGLPRRRRNLPVRRDLS